MCYRAKREAQGGDRHSDHVGAPDDSPERDQAQDVGRDPNNRRDPDEPPQVLAVDSERLVQKLAQATCCHS